MNFYTLFYWFTVSDKVRTFFDVFSNIFTTGAIITCLVFCGLCLIVRISDDDDNETNRFWILAFRRIFIWMTIFMFISWIGYIFVPTKKEMVLIVAGGAVGSFLTQDSTAKQLPHDIVVFLQSEIKSATKEAQRELLNTSKADSLKQLPKEQLIELLLKEQQ